MKKTVITVTHPDFKAQVLAEVTNTKTGPLNFGRVVEVENEKSDSLYNFNVMLSDEEIALVEVDARVKAIRIGSKKENGIESSYGLAETKTVSANSATITANEVNYGLVVCSNTVDNVVASAQAYSFEKTLTGLGVDVVIVDTGVLRDHPELSNASGASRVVELDWPLVTGTQALYPSFTVAEHYDQNYPTQNSHGTCMAGLAAGKTCGWATEALIYPIRIYGSDSSVFTLNQAINLIRLWHNSKKTSGNYRPTVVAISTSSFYTSNTFAGGTYRGTAFSFTEASSASDKGSVRITDQFSLNLANPFPFYSSTLAADCQAATDAGVILVNNSGNQGAYVDSFNGPDWNNIAGGKLYNRGGTPSSEVGVITAGNIGVETISGKRVVQINSNRGPGVTLYAPGQDTVTCATAGTNQGLATPSQYTPSVRTQYPGTSNANYQLGKFGGTSAACPQIAGVLALLAQANPYMDGYAAIALLKEYQKVDRVHTPTVSFTDGASLWGDTGRYLFNATANTNLGKFSS